jgi:Flp pilus assembly protein TadG
MALRMTFPWGPGKAACGLVGFVRALLRDRRCAALAGAEDGSQLVEFALSISALFLLIFCFMEISLLVYSFNLISYLARQGTRYAMVRGASCLTTTSVSCEVTASQVNSYVLTAGLPNLAGGAIVVATTYASAGSTTYTTTGSETVGSSVKVKVTYSVATSMPFVTKNSYTMASTSVMTIIQ